MDQAVSRRPVTPAIMVRSQVSQCWVCGGQSGTGTGFCPSTSVSVRVLQFFPVTIIPPKLRAHHHHHHHHTAAIRRTSGG